VRKLLAAARHRGNLLVDETSFYRPVLIALCIIIAATVWIVTSGAGSYLLVLIRDPKKPFGLKDDFVAGLMGNLLSGAIEGTAVYFVISGAFKRAEHKRWRGLPSADRRSRSSFAEYLDFLRRRV
jgi:hypothetical protein